MGCPLKWHAPGGKQVCLQGLSICFLSIKSRKWGFSKVNELFDDNSSIVAHSEAVSVSIQSTWARNLE